MTVHFAREVGYHDSPKEADMSFMTALCGAYKGSKADISRPVLESLQGMPAATDMIHLLNLDELLEFLAGASHKRKIDTQRTHLSSLPIDKLFYQCIFGYANGIVRQNVDIADEKGLITPFDADRFDCLFRPYQRGLKGRLELIPAHTVAELRRQIASKPRFIGNGNHTPTEYGVVDYDDERVQASLRHVAKIVPILNSAYTKHPVVLGKASDRTEVREVNGHHELVKV
jgi:hypothetical protein